MSSNGRWVEFGSTGVDKRPASLRFVEAFFYRFRPPDLGGISGDTIL